VNDSSTLTGFFDKLPEIEVSTSVGGGGGRVGIVALVNGLNSVDILEVNKRSKNANSIILMIELVFFFNLILSLHL